jgi:hypothetical protein
VKLAAGIALYLAGVATPIAVVILAVRSMEKPSPKPTEGPAWAELKRVGTE